MAPGIPDLMQLMHAPISKPATAAGLTAQPALSEIEAKDIQGTLVQRPTHIPLSLPIPSFQLV